MQEIKYMLQSGKIERFKARRRKPARPWYDRPVILGLIISGLLVLLIGTILWGALATMPKP